MKDIKSVNGNRFISGEEYRDDLQIVGVTVKNKSANGRRLGVFSRDHQIVMGQQVHQADALHEPKVVTALPAGYSSGKEVNLSPKRNYFKVFTGSNVKLVADWLKGSDEVFHTDSDFNIENPKFSATIPDITKGRLSVSSGNMNVGLTKINDNLNRFVSFTFIFIGQPYHIGLDLGKHPAVITAELNYRLNRIHPTLRGYVAIESVANGIADYGIYFTAPDNLDVIFPLTTFPTKNNLCRFQTEVAGKMEQFETAHLNKFLPNALLLNRTGLQNTTNTVSSITGPAIATAAAMIAAPYVVDMTLYSHPPETPTTYKGQATIPANAFKTWDKDHRLNIAVVKLKRNFVDGRIFKFNSIRYVDDANVPLPYDHAYADVLVIPAPYEGQDIATGYAPGLFIDDMTSEDADNFEAYASDIAKSISFAEAGNLNEADVGAYLVLLPRPTEDSRNSIFFRQTNVATRIEISYELVEADVIPALKLEDIGDVDYHKVTQVANGFVPLSFMASPITSWGLDFIVENQTDRFSAYQFEPDQANNRVRMLTHGTVGEMVLVNGLNWTGIQSPTSDIPFYHINKQIGCQSWLTKNLLPTGVVTSRIVTAVKSDYRILFPTAVMPIQEIDPFAEDGLIASQQDGSLIIKGRFSNPALLAQYENKGQLLHLTALVWSFTLNGNAVNPTEAVTIDKATGEWSTRISIANLVSPGPGTPTLRVTLTGKYPWLSGTTQYTASQTYAVRASVEGVEDDISFIPVSMFDADTSQPVNGKVRIMDMDNGQVLAEGNTLEELEADAIAKGLVDLEFVYGDPSEVAKPNDCEPTSLDFIPSVAFNDSSETFVLNFKIDVDGEIQTGQILAKGEIVDLLGGGIQAENLAEYLFLYGLNDLMRPDRHNMNAYFNYTPFSDGYDLVAGQHITISGLPSTYSDENYIVEPKSVTLSLVLAENLESGQRDYVSEQFGHEISIHSCIHRTAI